MEVLADDGIGRVLLAPIQQISRAFAMAAPAIRQTRSAAGFLVLGARGLEQMRIVRLVDESEALPGVLPHVEHERFDFVPASLHRKTRAACAIQFGLHLSEVDHGRLHHVSNFDTVAQFLLFCKCSCYLWKTCDTIAIPGRGTAWCNAYPPWRLK